jgi:hypothetical protein
MIAKYVKSYLLLEGGDQLECWFNPPSLTLSSRGSWKRTPVPGRKQPLTEYSGGCADSLSLTLLLHAVDRNMLQDSKTGALANAQTRTPADVKARIKELNALLDPKKQAGAQLNRPPLVQFVWGTYVSFVAVCKSVKVTTELFDIDGTPMRALVDLVIEQYQDEPGEGMSPPQNPTSLAREQHTSHRVQVGDSLASIAWDHYKDSTRWRDIATANGIDDPLKLQGGTILTIPTGRP